MHEIITLSNGLRVVLETVPHVQSVTAGVWVGAGSYRETEENNGISHFIEHMLFKGTRTRSAKDLAEAIDDVGGQINAFTGRDCTCYYTKVLSEHVETALDVLSDMLLHPLLTGGDLSVERQVILEEIAMYEDTPEELVHDVILENAWKGSPLGYNILGTRHSLERIGREEILSYMAVQYTPQNAVLSVVGCFDREELAELLERYFGVWAQGAALPPAPDTPVFFPGRTNIKRDIEQIHLCLAYDAPERGHPMAYPMMVLNTILGAGMSSRLFQHIREEKGLVYSIYSYQSVYARAGIFGIYAGMNPARLAQVEELIYEELRELKRARIDARELGRCREQLKGSLILGLESTSSRMHSFGQSLLLINKIRTPREILDSINAVDLEQIAQCAELVLKNPAAAVVGRESGE